MFELFVKMVVLCLFVFTAACSPIAPPPSASMVIPGEVARQIVRERLAAVVVTTREELGSWVRQRFDTSGSPGDADGGSAAPITPDGYFLTADHVLTRSDDRNVFIIYGSGGRIVTGILLAVARIAGETAPLLLTSFGNNVTSFDLSKAMASLPIAIYQQANSGFPDLIAIAWSGALLITAGVLAINIVARVLLRSKI
jgi:hypothetical protein